MLKFINRLTNNPWLYLSQTISFVIIAILLWGTCVAIFGEGAVPGSQFFQLATLFISAKVFGSILNLFFIPAVLGQMFMGALLANIGYLQFSETYKTVIRYLRKIAIMSILLPGSLGLNPDQMKIYYQEIVLVSFIPSTIEFIVVTFISVLFMHLPWSWSLVLGLILSSPPPAIIIGCILELESRGFGFHKGINLISVSACIINDVVNMAIFDIVLDAVIGAKMSVMVQVSKYLSAVIGLVYGVIFGLIGQFMPHPEDFFVVPLRTLMIASISMFAIIGSSNLQVMGAGIIGCILSIFIACIGWRRYGWDDNNPVRAVFSLFWTFIEPISFSLIGIEVKLDIIQTHDIINGSILVIASTVIRFLSCFMVLCNSRYSKEEKLFLSIVFLSKATIQAAIGPLPLERVQLAKPEDELLFIYADRILTTSVLAIILTAPFGAFLILFWGPRLLKKERPSILNYGNRRQIIDNNENQNEA